MINITVVVLQRAKQSKRTKPKTIFIFDFFFCIYIKTLSSPLADGPRVVVLWVFFLYIFFIYLVG